MAKRANSEGQPRKRTPKAATAPEPASQPSSQPSPAFTQSNPKKLPFLPKILDKTVIAIPLLTILEQADPQVLQPVIIDLNLEYPGGRRGARKRVLELIVEAIAQAGASIRQGIDEPKSEFSEQYLFGRLTRDVIRKLVELDQAAPPPTSAAQAGPSTAGRAIYRIWPDFPIRGTMIKSVSTVKADAARVSFSALGKNIVWAVMDSGIDAEHPHFKKHGNLKLDEPIKHRDFTALTTDEERSCVDQFGHGTHVAGIIAGEVVAGDGKTFRAVTRHRDEQGDVVYETTPITAISGMAPECKLLSLKVLDDNGEGLASNLIAAIAYLQEINGYGRRIRIHGVNMSVGYDFEPEWFACGQSPLCVEVDRLVRSGVVVVVAAGNTGYGVEQTEFRGVVRAGLDLTINDPGNAELAITVGSTHRDMPHVYGVSYFSSKGPTGDGRLKPDLVAPGEKILSCATGAPRDIAAAKMSNNVGECTYREESGTSMAAPHVSGAIAAFLSVRREFIGQPERVKDIFLSTATDLKRDRYFQGHGLVDLMRAIQSV